MNLIDKILGAAACAAALVSFPAEAADNVCADFNLRLKGPIGKQLDRMIENHLAATDIDYITAPFSTHNERKWLWRTEFWGKFMHAAEPFQKYSGNAKLRQVIDRGVEEMYRCIDPKTGYLGNYPEECRCPQGQGWDIWGMKYSMMGFLHHYDATGDRRALEAARKVCGYLIDQFLKGKRSYPLATTGFCAGMPSLSNLEPVMWLYNRTKDKEVLALADYIVAQMDDPKVGPELLRNADAAVWNRQDPKAPKPVWNHDRNRLKAYEMMSCYQGLVEYGLATGKRNCIDAARKTAESIVKDELNLAGGSCSSEHWFHGAIHQHEPWIHLQETCVTITWMRLCEKLAAVTDDPKWSDELEKTFFNSYLGAMRPDGSEFAGYTPLSGYRYHGQHHCRMHTDCCNANGPRGFLAFLRNAAVYAGDTLTLNQYASSVVTGKLADGRDFGLDVYSRYPYELSATINTRNAGRAKLRLRIPGWCAKAHLQIRKGAPGTNAPVQEKIDVDRAGYFTLDRDWQCGELIDLWFEAPVVAHVVDHHVAFTRGPVLLARDSRYGAADLNEVIRHPYRDGETVPGDLYVRSPSEAIGMTVTLPLELGSHSENPEGTKPSQVSFCDYASAGNAWRPENYYRTWFPLELRPWEQN